MRERLNRTVSPRRWSLAGKTVVPPQYILYHYLFRRGARAVESDGLENRCAPRVPWVRIPPSPQIMYYVYILKSLKDEKHYYGSTSNLDKRLSSHNSGKVRSTKSRRPLIVIYFESFETKSEALKREFFFKSKPGYYWLKNNHII